MSASQSLHSESAYYVNVGTAERVLSVAAGAFVAVLGLRTSGSARFLLAAIGGALALRGIFGYSTTNQMFGRDTARRRRSSSIELKQSLTVLRPRSEVYNAWRRLEDLPRFMTHLREVRQIDGNLSHWIAGLPRDAGSIEWDARLVADEAYELLAWRSEPGAVVENAGEVLFRDAPGGRGTEVIAKISYRPAAGSIGSVAARTLNPIFARMVREDLRRFKHVLEAGEVPTSHIQAPDESYART